jgi:hypothetical protein
MTPTQRRSGIRLPWSHEEEPEESDAPDAPSEPTSEVAAMSPTAASAASSASAPTADEVSPAPATVREPASGAQEGRDLLASLVTAMREVAEHERATTLASLRGLVDGSVETLRLRGAEGADTLRQRAETDISGIGEWVKAETERIAAEGDRKIESRRQQLTQQLTDHEHRSQDETESLRARVDEYERELGSFFAQLNEIEDPAAFGAAAKRMPRPPVLTGQTAPSTATPSAGSSTAADAPAAASVPEAPSEAATTSEASGPSEEVAAPSEEVAAPSEEVAAPSEEVAAPSEEVAAPSEAATTNESPVQAEVPASSDAPAKDANPVQAEVPASSDAPAKDAKDETKLVEKHRIRLDALGLTRDDSPTPATTGPTGAIAADAAATGVAAGPAAAASPDHDPLRARLAELDATIGPDETADPATAGTQAPGAETATAIVVHGLGSFGAITSFKQALERVEGVHGISLALGPTGEFVYRATHDGGFDLVGAIERIEQGGAQIERQADGSLRVNVKRTR